MLEPEVYLPKRLKLERGLRLALSDDASVEEMKAAARDARIGVSRGDGKDGDPLAEDYRLALSKAAGVDLKAHRADMKRRAQRAEKANAAPKTEAEA